MSAICNKMMSAVHKLIEELRGKTTRVEKFSFEIIINLSESINGSLMLKVRVLREKPGLSPILSNFHDVESCYTYLCFANYTPYNKGLL